jgi:polyisoprenoid-binding protein YceI
LPSSAPIVRSAPDADCRIFTFKEGVLSPLAHDLELQAEVITVTWDEGAPRIEARVDPSRVKVLWAIRDGRPDPAALTASDRRKIESTLAEEVLQVRRWPEVRFASTFVRQTGERLKMEGQLALAGRERPLHLSFTRVDGRWTGEIELHQPDWGITPFRAALGTLRVKPRVRVRLSVRA